MTLYDIDNRLRNFEPEVDEETGELLNAAELDSLQMERDAKIEGVALWVKELDAEAAAIKAERDALAERQRAKERKRDSLKRYLQTALNGEKFETARCKVSYRKTSSVQVNEFVFEPWAKEHAPELLRETIEYKPEKAAIKDAIRAGMNVIGAQLVESTSMTVR